MKNNGYDKSKLPELVFESRPDLIELYNTTWQMAFDNIECPAKPGWLPQMGCMPGSGKIWQWDSCFMAIFAKYANNEISPMNNLDNLYRLQRYDGYISMAYIIEQEKEAYQERINPPLYAWIEWEYYLFTGDDSRFERVYTVLDKYYNWLKANRRRNNGLYWFEDTGSSGMDNSPRSSFQTPNLLGSDVCFIDLCCQQALSAHYLSLIARKLGKIADEESFAFEYMKLNRLINHYMWCERKSFYYDVFTRDIPELRHNFLSAKTAAAFWPILSGTANAEQIDGIVKHLLNPDEFWTQHPVPTLSIDDPNYDPKGGYWLGSVWAPTNYMIAAGLKKRGWNSISRDLTMKHLDAMTAVMKNKTFGGIWECYSPETPSPATKDENGGLVRDNFVGWSGLGPIAMLIENVLGLSFDASTNTVSWEIAESGAHGMKNLHFNGRTISLLCGKSSDPDEREIHIETSGEIKVSVTIAGRDEKLSALISTGRQSLHI